MADFPTDFQEYVKTQRGQEAATRALQAQDEDPKKAAGAVKLEQVTGQDPQYIYGNYDKFVNDQKFGIVDDLLNKNDFLREYALSHPLAATISRDDWGNLASYGETLAPAKDLDKYVSKDLVPRIGQAYEQSWQDTKHAIQQFGYQKQPTFEELQSLANLPPEKRAAQEAKLKLKWGSYGGLNEILGVAGGAPFAALGPVISDLAKVVEEATGLPTELGEQIGMYAVALGGVRGAVKGAIPERPIKAFKEAPRTLSPQEIAGFQDTVDNLIQRTNPWVKAGELPPLGADRILDTVLGGDAHANMAIIENMIKGAAKTETGNLSPEMIQKMTEIATKQNIAFNYDDVRALYGDKVPEPGDGLLGDLTGVAEQFIKNDRTGEEITVPIAEFIAKKLEPDVWKALKDGVRGRADGATLREFEQFKTPEYQASRASVPRKEIEGYGPERVVEEDMARLENVEHAAGMEPYFRREAGVPPRRLQLTPSRGVPYPALKGEHSFAITDEIGRHVADLELTPSADGKDIEINWVGGHTPMHQTPERLRNMFSPGLMRDLLRQVQEQFPEAQTISGTKISGKEGRVSVDLAESQRSWEEVENLRDVFESGNWVQMSAATEALVKPRAAWTGEQNAIYNKVDALLNRVIPKYSRVFAAEKIRKIGTEREPLGTYIPPQQEGLFATVLWSFDSDHPTGTARHEAIHFLRRQGFITKDEWKVLTDAAIKGKWISKHDIAERYRGQGVGVMLEESVAEEFRTWADAKNKDQHPGNFFYQKFNNLMLAIKDIINKHYGRMPSVNELFENVEAGRVGSRENREKLPAFEQYWPKDEDMMQLRPEEQSLALESAKAQAAAAPEAEKVPLFAPGTLHPKATHNRYAKAMERWYGKKEDRERKLAVREEKRRMAPEWADNRLTMQQEVTADIKNRPDFLVQRFFQHGELAGAKTNILPKLDPKYIWPDLLEQIPKQFLAEGGMDPAKVAPMLGYNDGYSMVSDMADFARARGAEGPTAYVNRLIKDETDRRMQQKYGTPDDVALANAREDATSPQMFDLIHEDQLKFHEMARVAGHTVEMPLSKDAQMAAAWQAVYESTINKATLKESHKELGRIFRELESAYLGGTGDPVRAYKLSQRRAAEMAKSMVLRQIEKQKSKFETAMKAGYKRDPVGMPFNFAAYLHNVMTKIGREVKREPDDLARALAEDKYKGDIQAFADSLESHPVGAAEDEIERNPKLPVYEKLNDPNWTVDIDKTTVREFLEINNTVQALIHLGRDENRVTVLGKRLLLNAAVQELVGQMQKFKEHGTYVGMLPKGAQEFIQGARTIGLGLLRWSDLTERFDQFDRNGPWARYVRRPMLKAATERAVLERDHARTFQSSMKTVKGIEDFEPTREVPNDRIYDPNGWKWSTDPRTGKKTPFVPESSDKFKAMSEENLVMAIVYWLEPTARDKLVRGHLTSEAEMGSWIWQNSKKIHWDIADKIGEVFERFKKEEDDVSRRMNGSFIKRLPTPPVESPFGTVKGRYYPVVHDTSVAMPTGLKVHPIKGTMTTDKGMFKDRTDLATPLDLTFTTINHQMKRRTDFIAWEETLDTMRKIAEDPEFMQQLRVHHGPHVAGSFEDWIKDSAGRSGTMPEAARATRAAFNWFLSRSITSLVGFRSSTIGKHVPSAAAMGVREAPKRWLGTALDLNFLNSMRDLYQGPSDTMRMSHGFIDNGEPDIGFKGSEEIKSRGMKGKDFFPEAVDYALGKIGAPGKFRDGWNQVSGSIFRVSDNFFSRITYGSAYRDYYSYLTKEKGYSHRDAVFEADEYADEAVRISHGSMTATSLPEYLRQQDPVFKNSTALFAFWSHSGNRLWLTGARTKDMAMMRRNKTVFSDLANVSANVFVYALAPMIIEDLVEPICNRDQSNMACFTKWGAFSAAGFFPGGRELAWAALSGMNPGGGVVGSSWRSFAQIGKTVGQISGGDAESVDWGKTIKSSLFLASLLSGLAGGLQAGLVADYVWKLNHDEEELPKTTGEAAQLLFSGKIHAEKHEKQNIWGRMFGEGPNR